MVQGCDIIFEMTKLVQNNFSGLFYNSEMNSVWGRCPINKLFYAGGKRKSGVELNA